MNDSKENIEVRADIPQTRHDQEINEYYKRLAASQAKALGIDLTRTFESGAKRDGNDTKPYIHTLMGYTRQRFGYHMNIGAKKYGNWNFTKGIPTECYLESLDRHLAAYMSGDRSEDHLSAIIFNAQGCMLNEQAGGITSNYYFEGRNLVDSKALIKKYEETKSEGSRELREGGVKEKPLFQGGSLI